MELSPRTAAGPSIDPSPPRRRRRWAYAVLIVVLLGIGFVAYQGLTEASLYFYNADEAVAQREELGDERIRVQGVVQDDIEAVDGGGVLFTITFNDEVMQVVHEGDPPELFEPGIPVVLEGHWSTTAEPFLSDEIIVKHDEQYEAENEDRLEDAEDGESGGSSSP